MRPTTVAAVVRLRMGLTVFPEIGLRHERQEEHEAHELREEQAEHEPLAPEEHEEAGGT
jgi:hypothetical protein